MSRIDRNEHTANSFIRDVNSVDRSEGAFDAQRSCIRRRLRELRDALGEACVAFDREQALAVLEEILFDVGNEFAEEEMVLMKQGWQSYEGHHCSHQALLTAMNATKRAVLRCRSREDLLVAVDAIGDWLLNHFDTVDVRDEPLLATG